MQDNVQKEEGGISLFEIFRLLLSKIKLLILVVIIAGIAGAGLGLYTSWNDLYFGTRVEFYVNPEKSSSTSSESASQFSVYGAYGRHVMDNIVKLLESESFTEQLLLNGETLPKLKYTAKDSKTTPFGRELHEGEVWSWIKEPSAEERAAAPAGTVFLYDQFATAIKKAEELRATADAQSANLEAALKAKEQSLQSQNILHNLINQVWIKFYPSETNSPVFNEEAYAMLLERASNNSQLANNANFVELTNLYSDWKTANSNVSNSIATINHLDTTYFIPANEAETAVLELWRTTDGYNSILKMYSNSITFSYLESEADIDDANNLARSFIYVDISVVGEQYQAFAKEMHRRVKDIVPAFVEANMTVPADYQGTNCERITRTDGIQRTNPNSRTTQTVKFGLLAAFAALVVAAIVILIVDQSDKRLREPEIITSKFNLPVLGIVPPIEDLLKNANTKKTATAKTENSSTKEAK